MDGQAPSPSPRTAGSSPHRIAREAEDCGGAAWAPIRCGWQACLTSLPVM